MRQRKTKFIFITGGVVSSLGKGMASASMGALLENRGLDITLVKLDPYINVDPGTMSPFQHGEVYVTEDGAETDLDLGHYERFTGLTMTQANNVTAGAIYYSVITKDALPFGKSVGNRARIYGLNTIGLVRRGFTDDTIAQLKRAYRYLLQSKLNTSRALVQIAQDTTLTSPDVRYLVDFIRSSQRGVILRRPTRRAEELVADE